jgi:hypothetical protein
MIKTRPDPIDEQLDDMIGTGDNYLALTDDQLEYIMAIVGHTRLGHGSVYKQAAYELLGLFEEEFGSDATSEACENVGMQITIEDAHGGIVFRSDSSHDIILEV